MSLNQSKGNKLEKAVWKIEQTILEHNSSLKGVDFRIEPKKIEVINGVKHEVDLYIKFNTEGECDAIFIFECKNWDHKSVDKNEIIIFSEKVKVFKAQKGYFVAKSFGKYALAQANLDDRLEIILVKDYLDENFGLQPVHCSGPINRTFDIEFKKRDAKLASCIRLNVEKATCLYNNVQHSLRHFLDNETQKIISDVVFNARTKLQQTGRYPFEAHTELTYDNLIVNGDEIASINYGVFFTYINENLPTTVTARFDVRGRGKYLELEFEHPNEGIIRAEISAKDITNEI